MAAEPPSKRAKGGLATTLSPAEMAALKDIATKLCAPGKGFLASDESAGPWLRAGHVEAKKITDTPENRAAYRALLSMFILTPS